MKEILETNYMNLDSYLAFMEEVVSVNLQSQVKL